MANVNTFAQIIEIVQNLFPSRTEATAGNTTMTPNAPRSALSSSFSSGGAPLDHAALSQLLIGLQCAGFPTTGSISPGVVGSGEHSRYRDLNDMSALPTSQMQSLPIQLIQEYMHASSRVQLLLIPDNHLQGNATSNEVATESPVSELCRFASQLGPLGIDHNSVLASRFLPNNAPVGTSMSNPVSNLQELIQQWNQVKPVTLGTNTMEAALSALTNEGNTPESYLRPESSTSAKKKRRSSCGEVAEKKQGVQGEVSNDGDVATEPTHNELAVGPSGKVSIIMLPCRARGMSKDHNFHTAHFIIPPGLDHGADMICSHTICRDSGVKFRFCATCKLPVAKRNFNQRHSHDTEHCNPNNCTTASVSSPDNVPADVAQLVSHVLQGQTKRKANHIMEPSGVAKGLTSSQLSYDQSTTMLERKRKWSDLLEMRPASSDQSSMFAWLQEVIALSQSKNPSENTPIHGVASSDTERKASILSHVGNVRRENDVLGINDSKKTSCLPVMDQRHRFTTPLVHETCQLSNQHQCQEAGKASFMKEKDEGDSLK